MNGDVITPGLFGTLIVIFNRRLGVAIHRSYVERGGKDYGVWFRRGVFIFVGLLLTCLSFLYDR